MTKGIVLTGFALFLAAAVAPAESHEMTASGAAAYVGNLEAAGNEVVQLAEAIPAEDYGWRPMEGVRSVSEVLMHVASANYFFAGRLGTATPEGVDPQAIEKITDKAECVATVKASIEHLKTAYGAIQDTHAPMDVFGEQKTVEDMMLVAIGHVHEHLGQLIAYARSNQVVPPWSQPQGN